MTTIGVGSIPAHPDLSPSEPPAAPPGVTFADGALSGTEWETVVAEAVRRINAGALEKVVLARDLYATAREEVDVRWPLGRRFAACRAVHATIRSPWWSTREVGRISLRSG